MSNNCVIVFDQNEHGTYFTGQVVSGKVIITYEKSKKIKGIKLQICGYASCQWKQKHGKPRANHSAKPKKRKHMYYGREDYIASTTYLAGSQIGHNFTMEAGTYTYTFACPIPANCPSSYEGTYGHIRYLTKVTFIRSGASNRTTNVGFTVLKLLDLNQESRLLKEPVTNESMENFCFFHTKAVHLNVDILQTGYVPGQIILVSTHVSNDSCVDVKRLVITLNLRATYTSDTPCLRNTTEQICLVKKNSGPVQRYTRKEFADTIRVPATPPTCEHLSKVVRVSYEVCVVAVMNHFMRNPKTVIPITIGNVPLVSAGYPRPRADDVPTTSSCAMQLADGNAHNLHSEAIDVFAVEDENAEEDGTEADTEMELPPPTYEQAMFMTTDIADDDANTVSEAAQFTPRYPVFDVDSMQPASENGVLSPPPNLPQKRRRRKKRIARVEVEQEKPSIESPVQI